MNGEFFCVLCKWRLWECECEMWNCIRMLPIQRRKRFGIKGRWPIFFLIWMLIHYGSLHSHYYYESHSPRFSQNSTENICRLIKNSPTTTTKLVHRVWLFCSIFHFVSSLLLNLDLNSIWVIHLFRVFSLFSRFFLQKISFQSETHFEFGHKIILIMMMAVNKQPKWIHLQL